MRGLLLLSLFAFASISEAHTSIQTIDHEREYTIEDTQLVPQEPVFNKFGIETKTLFSKQGYVSAGRTLGVKVLGAAQTSQYPALSRVFAKMERQLPTTTIKYAPDGYDFKICDQGTLAFVIRGSRVIHLCNLSFTYMPSNNAFLAQVLVHEMAHVLGEFDECVATRFEQAAMLLSGVGVQFKNGYHEKCN